MASNLSVKKRRKADKVRLGRGGCLWFADTSAVAQLLKIAVSNLTYLTGAKLTFSLLTSHVMLDAGDEMGDEQLPRIVSPTP